MDEHINCSTRPTNSSSDPDPAPSEHDHTVAEEITRCIWDELQKQLALEETQQDEKPSDNNHEEEEEKVEEFMDGWSDMDGEGVEEAQNGYNATLYGNDNGYDKVDDDWESEKKTLNSNGSNGNGVKRYPVRPEAEDCAFYIKTGNCKFGSNCKFNHPVTRERIQASNRVKDKEEGTKKPGQMECKYYLRTGGCKYGEACRYNHSRSKSFAHQAKAQVFPAKTLAYPVIEFNFLGLPIRPGEKECPYYMRNGSCKYGSNCRFNHPDPTAVGGNDPPLPFGNGGSASVQGSSQASVASWSPPRALNETTPFMPIMFPPTQGVPPQSPEWNGYQAPLYPQDRSAHPPPAYIIGNPTSDNVFAQQQKQIIVDEFPERLGQPECSFFLKTGDCKFKSNCKYHHPKNRISKSSQCPLSDKGLPLRPDQNICSHYSRYGICKFGPACKFNHPEQLPSIGFGQDQSAPFGNYESKEEARITESGNGSDAAIKHPV